LHSFALAALAYIQARGVLRFLFRPLLLHSVWHLLICMRGDVFYVSNPTTLCQRIMPPRNMVPTQKAWEPLAWVGVVKVSSSAAVHIEMEEQSTTTCNHATTAAVSRHASYMLVVSTLRLVWGNPMFTNPFLIFVFMILSLCEHSLIIQVHASFVYLACSGLDVST
jgi:hypothetical protein